MPRADGEMTHCSACGRRVREKRVRGTLGGNYATPGAPGYTDWLNHAKRPLCPRYGLPPDTTGEVLRDG